MKYLIFGAIVIYLFYLATSGKKNSFTYFLVFISSFSAYLFKSEEIHLSLAAILVIIFFPIFLDGFKEGVGGLFLVSTMITIWGLVVGWFNVHEQYSIFHELSLSELFNFSFLPMVSLLYFGIIKNFINEDNLNYFLVAFISSVFLQLLSVVVAIFGISNMPEFISSSVDLVPDIVDGQIVVFERYGALIGDYELVVDYSMIVIAFAAMYGLRTRRYGYSVLFSALAVMLGALTGTRSLLFIIGFTFFLTIFLGIVLVKKNKSSFMVFSAAVASFAIIFLASVISETTDFAIVNRLGMLATSYTEGAGIETLLNRKYSYAIELISNNVPFYGLGGFRFSDLMGNEIVSHNLFMSFTLRYGYIVAVLIFVAFVLFLRNTYIAIKSASDDMVKWQLIILLSTSLALFVQQMKVSFVRGSVGVILYTLWFTVSYFYIKTSKANNGDKHSTLGCNVRIQR